MTARQIKSQDRVRDHGEVFTAEREVKAMCDLLPNDEIWSRIDSTFLEPSCGNGNFLVEIYLRKLAICQNEKDGLLALSCIVGIDIMIDNVEESRERLLRLFVEKFPNASEFSIELAKIILKNNIICGDSLRIMEEWVGEPTHSKNKKRRK